MHTLTFLFQVFPPLPPLLPHIIDTRAKFPLTVCLLRMYTKYMNMYRTGISRRPIHAGAVVSPHCAHGAVAEMNDAIPALIRRVVPVRDLQRLKVAHARGLPSTLGFDE